MRKRNRRSLHDATPDFLWELVALANLMRLSLLKAAHVVASSAAWQEIRVRSGRDDNLLVQTNLSSRSELNPFPNTVPQGRLNLAQDASPGWDLKGRPVPQGRLEMGRDPILDNRQPSLRDSIILHDVPRTSVLG
jgi:hypothetical protein